MRHPLKLDKFHFFCVVCVVCEERRGWIRFLDVVDVAKLQSARSDEVLIFALVSISLEHLVWRQSHVQKPAGMVCAAGLFQAQVAHSPARM